LTFPAVYNTPSKPLGEENYLSVIIGSPWLKKADITLQKNKYHIKKSSVLISDIFLFTRQQHPDNAPVYFNT
jgi:hypothetical protein